MRKKWDEIKIMYQAGVKVTIVADKDRFTLAGERQPAEAALSPAAVEKFLADMVRRGRAAATIKAYRRNLRALYAWLPEGDKGIYRDTLVRWRRDMLEQGVAPRTVNARMAAANSLLRYLGRQELQVLGQVTAGEAGEQPELTRGEYLRLLDAARRLGKERAYLLTKAFAVLGLTPGELPILTVECVEIGEVYLSGGRRVTVPVCLGRELGNYARRLGVETGPVFITREGRLLHRSSVNETIRQLGGAAQVPEEKATPRCLKKLYQSTQDRLRESVEQLLRQTYDQMLEAEQASIGWPDQERRELA